MLRESSLTDFLIQRVDDFLRVLFIPQQRSSVRENPAIPFLHPTLSSTEQRHVAGLVRVNHAGEICAQGLYQGQALTARLESTKTQMEQAALEEVDHLAWCEERLRELKNYPSILNPFWYAGSLCLGALAGLIGDQWSLGFVAETERQVTQHLMNHLQRLPNQDERTRAILQQMVIDESAHAHVAIAAGAEELPFLIKKLMYAVSKLLTTSSYYI